MTWEYYIFDTYYKCKIYSQTDNQCREKYCKTCKDYVDDGHQCYMIPVDNVGPGKIQTYICFSTVNVHKTIKCSLETDSNLDSMDFEYIARNRHVKFMNNLSVLHKVYTSFLEKDVLQESFRDKCRANEIILNGEQSTETFCTCLITTKKREFCSRTRI